MNQKRNVKHRSSSKQFLPDKEKRTASNKKSLSLKKVFKIVFYCSIFIAFIYAVVASPLLKIKKVEITGLQTLNNSEINDQVEKILASSYLNQNILFVSADQINSQLKADNYQIAKAEIVRIPFNTLKIVVKEQKPSILWQSNGTLSIFTEDGRAYSGEPSEQLKSSLPTVVDTANLEVTPGAQVVSVGFLGFVNKIYKELPDKNIVATKFEIKDTTTELFVTTQEGYVIRLDSTRPASEQITDLITVLDLLKQQGKKPLEYIDLRINGKAFYK